VSFVRGSGLHTGCDIQLVRPRLNAAEIAGAYFSASEREYAFSGDEAGFFEIWVLKECFLKLRGFSVFDMPRAPSFISEDGRFGFSGPDPLSFYLYELNLEDERYMLAAALEGADLVPAIRWFSQGSPPLRSIAEIKAAPSPAKTVSPKI
jgi:phosphopantetheinyl transferase